MCWLSSMQRIRSVQVSEHRPLYPCIICLWRLQWLWRLGGWTQLLWVILNRQFDCFWPDCKPEGPLFSAEFVCLRVCLWPALLPFIVNRFWRNLVTRTLLWSSLAATIMVQIGRRGTARRLFENLKKFSKNHRTGVVHDAPQICSHRSLYMYCRQRQQRHHQACRVYQ